MQHIRFAAEHTVLIIPACPVKNSLTTTNKRPAAPLRGSRFEERAKLHCGGRRNDALPLDWVQSSHNGQVFYYQASTNTSSYAHPVAVQGATWSEGVRGQKRYMREQRLAPKQQSGHAKEIAEMRVD